MGKTLYTEDSLKNKTVNNLTLKERSKKYNQKTKRWSYWWLCKCICGNKILRSQDGLTSNRSTSCGCKRKTRSKYTEKELKNKKFEHLTLIKRISKKKKKGSELWWLCKCDCGKEVYRIQRSILKYIAKSCGCKSKRKRNGKDSPFWKGCGEINGQFFGTIKENATRRNIPFNITIEYIWNLFLKQNRKCALTGLLLTICTRYSRQNNKNLEHTASLDRINSKQGYVKENVWWVHKNVNFMKWDLDLEEFKQYCKLITEHDQSKSQEAIPQS